MDVDVREADKLEGTSLEEFYETMYRKLCWNVHGSGLTGIRYLSEDGFDCWAGYACGRCANFAMICVEIIVDAFGFAKYHQTIQQEIADIKHRANLLVLEKMNKLSGQEFKQSDT